MKTISAVFLASAMYASDYGLDAYAFGLSHHSNREYDWNEINTGFALSPWKRSDENSEFFLVAGMYRNSLHRESRLGMVGFRLFKGTEMVQVGLTMAGGLLTGYGNGSGYGNLGSIVGMFTQVGPVSLECAYQPCDEGDKSVPGTAVLACWLRFRLVGW